MHRLDRRRRFLLLILLCEVSLFVLMYMPQSLTPPVYFPAKLVHPSMPVSIPDEHIVLLENLKFEAPSDLEGWEEKAFNGKTEYQLVREPARSYLQGVSSKACSGYYRPVNVEITPDLVMEWSWRARTFPSRGYPPSFHDKKQDDFAARIYLVFPAANYFKSDVMEYVWDEHAPEGTIATSPYSDRIKMLVIRTGAAAGDGWVNERRNVLEDYQKLFNKMPQKPIGIIAVMTDSDNTRTQSAADFGPIRIFRKSE